MLNSFLKSLQIICFQAHRKSIFNFHENLNVVCGLTATGKSAMIRAMFWLANNRPKGDSFKSNFTDRNTVKVISKFFDKTKVVRRKNNKGLNEYIINDDTENPLEALRTDVPDEVRNAVQLSDVNFQLQHSQYFLIDDTPGQVAKKMNKLADLDFMDTVLKNINSIVSKITTKIKSIKEIIKETKVQLKESSWVLDIDSLLVPIESINTEIEEKENNINTLKNAVTEIKTCKEKIKKLKNVKVLLEQVKEVETLQTKLSKKERNVYALQEFIKSIKQAKKVVKQFSDLDTHYDSYNKLKVIVEKLESKNKTCSYLTKAIEKLKCLKSVMANNKIKHDEYKLKYKNKLRSLKMCPTCGALNKHQNVGNIL